MNPRPSPRFLAVMVAALVLVLVSFQSQAQYQTGNIYGTVLANDGAVMPGATISLTGVGAPLVTVTDAQGHFRFLNLSPGTYSIRAELAGFGAAIRSGVGISTGQNSNITMTMSPSVAEAITVMAEAPLLDVRKTGTGANISRFELENVPSARDPWMILQSTPGVQVDRINVGGTQSGQQSIYISKGAPRSDGTWNIDGVNITDMGATGSSPTYYDFDTFEELNVTTGGSDPRIQTAGVQLNMVTKRGTNDYRGSGRYLYVPGSTSAEASVPAEAAGYLSRTNSVNYVRDYGGEIGGPVFRDRLWLWAARGDQKISTWQSLRFPAPAFFIPDDTILRNRNLKVNAQPLAANSFVASYTYGDKYRNARDLSPTRPFEAAWKQTGPTKVYKLEDTHVVNSNFFLTGMWSKVDGGFGLFANGGTGPDAPAFYQAADQVFTRGYFTFQTVRPQKQYRLDGSAFVDAMGLNHELKFGLGYRDTPVTSATSYPGPASGYWSFSSTLVNATNCTAHTGSPDCGLAFLYRPPQASYSGEYTELYVGDTILFGNVTVQAGLRYDLQESKIQPMEISANPILGSALTLPRTNGTTVNALLPGISFPGQDKALEWKSISPRIGVTYALGTGRQTLLRGSYNRYVSQLGSTVASSSPVGNSYFAIYGLDLNGDRTIQREELKTVRNFAGINPANPTSLTSTRRVDYDMNPPTTDELVLGIDRELWTDFVIGASVTHRRTSDLVALRYEKTQGVGNFYTTADYIPFVNASGNPVTVAGTQVYGLKPGVAAPVFSVITNRPNYEQTFSGLELTATKRMSNDWMLRFNAAFNDYTDDCGTDSFANPTPALNSTGIVNGAAAYGGAPACAGGQVAPQSAGSGAFGNVFVNSRWSMNLNGVYVLPWDINVGASFNARQGYPAVFRQNVPGVGLIGTVGGVVPEPIGDTRFENVYQLDMRIAKDFRFMDRMGVTLSIDVFNLPNERTVLQRNTLNAPVSSARITEIQAPRVWRFGAKATF